MIYTHNGFQSYNTFERYDKILSEDWRIGAVVILKPEIVDKIFQKRAERRKNAEAKRINQ